MHEEVMKKAGKKGSVWGKEDKKTTEVLSRLCHGGKWLNLAAGDGRYNSILLKKAKLVVATDIDKKALKKLRSKAAKKHWKKLEIKIFDLTKRFPFGKETFDGIFCTGTLHLFHKKILKGIFREIGRVLKPKGTIVIDFATDIKRVLWDGTDLQLKKSEPQYTLKEADEFLEKYFKNYKIKMHKCRVPKQHLNIDGLKYTFECKYVLLIAKKG